MFPYKIGFKNLRTGTEAKFRPFVDAQVKDMFKLIKRRFLIGILKSFATLDSTHNWLFRQKSNLLQN